MGVEYNMHGRRQRIDVVFDDFETILQRRTLDYYPQHKHTRQMHACVRCMHFAALLTRRVFASRRPQEPCTGGSPRQERTTAGSTATRSSDCAPGQQDAPLVDVQGLDGHSLVTPHTWFGRDRRSALMGDAA